MNFSKKYYSLMMFKSVITVLLLVVVLLFSFSIVTMSYVPLMFILLLILIIMRVYIHINLKNVLYKLFNENKEVIDIFEDLQIEALVKKNMAINNIVKIITFQKKITNEELIHLFIINYNSYITSEELKELQQNEITLDVYIKSKIKKI